MMYCIFNAVYLVLVSLFSVSLSVERNATCTRQDINHGGSCGRIGTRGIGRHQIPPPTQNLILEIIQQQKNFEAQSANQTIDDGEEIEIAVQNYGGNFSPEVTDSKTGCPKPSLNCRNSQYRTVDGSCNNLKNSRWGKSLECLDRILDASYSDDQSVPRRSVTGKALPSPRVVSLNLHPHERASASVSHMLMQFGQFLDHDISQTPATPSTDGPINCCNPSNGIKHPECMEIPIPADDPFYSQFRERCINFVRSATCLSCQKGARQLISIIGAFIDGSQVYGSSTQDMRLLRTMDGTGTLRVAHADNGGELLPPSPDTKNDQCSLPERNLICFKAGDTRVNQQAALVALHTTWLRQHNSIARKLSAINPHWREEKLFQETRRIIGAQLQMITYSEFLPLVLGDAAMTKNKLTILKDGFTEYMPELNPTIFTEFSSAAYRFGHSLVSGSFSRTSHRGTTRTFPLRDNWFNPFSLYNGDMDQILRGMMGKQAARFDPFFDEDIRNHLYKPSGASFGSDLVSLNVQRGRDHGLNGYTKYVQFCSNDVISSFEQLDKYMPRQQRIKFEQTYARVEDIDLFSGGVSELPVDGALIGPTFACIISLQFKNLKFGDRYWFEHRAQAGSFTQAQLQSLRQTLLSKVICSNGDQFNDIHKFVMQPDSDSDPVTSCQQIPDVDLTPWRER